MNDYEDHPREDYYDREDHPHTRAARRDDARTDDRRIKAGAGSKAWRARPAARRNRKRAADR